MVASRARVAFSVVCNLVISVLLGTSWLYRFVKRIFPLKPKIFLLNSTPVPILAINDLPKHSKDKEEKAQNRAATKKNHAPRRIWMVRQTKIQTRS